LGNLLNRSLTMIERFAKGVVPEPLATTDTELDNLLQQTAQEMLRTFDIHLGSLEFNSAGSHLEPGPAWQSIHRQERALDPSQEA